MKNLMIAAAVAAALSYLPAGAEAAAASSDDVAQIREQLQGLMRRVDKLEQENTALKSENEALKAQGGNEAEIDYLKSEIRGLRKEAATTTNEVNKVKGADWAGKVSVKGDLRYRYEYISDKTETALNSGIQSTADRYRDRIRARVNVEAKPLDNILVGVGFATTEGGDPRSSNQTLGGTFSRKSLDLDLAYFDWKFASWGNLIGGKMKQPFFKTTQSPLWDNDINPEGLAVNFNRGILFGTAYNYWISEVSGAENTVTADSSLVGAQLGVRLPVGGASTLALAAHYYDLSAGQGRRNVLFGCTATSNGCANGNTTIGAAGAGVLAFDYEVINLTAEYNTVLGTLPLMLWADAAQNQEVDDLDTAWGAGVLFGKASNPKTWELGAAYVTIEKDAVFAQLIDSDFGGGTSDSEGWVLRAGYAPLRNWTLNATYFINKRNVDVASAGQTETDYDRLQVDFNVKF